MTTTPPLPRTIPAWIKALDDAPLPAFAGVHGKVRLALRDSSKSMRQIAELIQDSPVLALRFIQEANRGIGDSQPAESLEVALSRIGLQRAEALLARIPAMEAADMPQPLRQLVLISRHASQQANGLFAARLARLWQDIHWGSLLFLSPAWALIGAYPHLLDSWEQRVLVKGEPASRVERELLGVSLLELCLRLAEHWRLPDWIIQGYRLLGTDRRRLIKALHIAHDNEHPLHQQQMLDADPDLRRWLTLPSNTIVLANGLALSSHHSWSGVHSLRWQRLAGLYLQVSLADLQQMVHQQAATSAREIGRTDLWHPAQGLLWPTGTRFQVLRAAPVASDADLAEWREHCRRLLSEPTPFSNVLQLTATASQALACAGMQRTLVLLFDRKQNRLVAQQSAGLPSDAARLTLTPEQSQIVRRLLEKPAQLRLQPANMAQFSALLPGSLKALFSGEHLLLRSLGIDGRVLMLVVSDQNGAPFSDTTLQTFAKTTQCIERALATFSRRGV
ncbi:histidine kinase [Stutzerimonas stutzeri]|uniref:HDOD domain-containing protein n=1 Tax=Stutzerimonas stutzeri subgroup TaxID=578833 RepID=UPI0005F22257|nr:HDOD domain-containing protein [Stutzerimonas kunmingensis]KJS24719.1 MAG: histidine kinase [Pseudomonas sp. BRH_c35]KKJ98782.1 histidine kinase [Stutzerimonas stutzeri]MBU0565980.1 HDOD domain-containing protein [Gammaproteobacteria bacterium]MBU1803767.1 HDOD domain-containing protein [Gammaproteobacteria bacterium]MBU2331693.1 HDOD domain-containing protein [Gammaproteobacteria bacterium]